MKKFTRRLSILLVLCLLLTAFTAAATPTKQCYLADIDTSFSVPADIHIWDEEEMTEFFDDQFSELVDAMTLILTGDDEKIDITYHSVMNIFDEQDRMYMGMVFSMPNEDETAIDFRDLIQEEFEDFDEIFSTIFTLPSEDGMDVSAGMIRTAEDVFLRVFCEITEEGENLSIEYYITYRPDKVYLFAFIYDMPGMEDTSRAIMDTAVIGRGEKLPGGFVDLVGHWAEADVQKAVDLGLFKGSTATTFDPDGGMTRAMLVQVLYRMEGQPETGESKFSDVAADAWYADAVAWASENGIVKGSGGKFDPDGLLTREQLAAILWRYAQYEGRDVSVGEDTNILSYNDAFSVSEYAYAPLQWACGDGLIKGSSGNLMPQGTTTRAQVATILVRYLAE